MARAQPCTATLRELTAKAAAVMGVSDKVRALPYAAVWAAGLANPFIKELRETQHQFRRPFVLDSTAAQQAFDLAPHSTDESVRFDIANGAPAPR